MDLFSLKPPAEKEKGAPNHGRSLASAKRLNEQHMADAPLRGRAKYCLIDLKSLTAQVGGLREAVLDARASFQIVTEAEKHFVSLANQQHLPRSS